MRTIAAALAVLSLAAAACGGSAGPPAGSIKVTMTDFAFTPSDLHAAPGSATFYLVNEGKSAHDFAVLDAAGKQLAVSDLVQPGNTTTLTVKLAAGSYDVRCDQPSHAEAGMTAKLTVS